MSETFVCDACDERIEVGHTVAWCPDLEDNAHGVAWDRHVEVRNLCRDCWPEKRGLIEKVKSVVGLS